MVGRWGRPPAPRSKSNAPPPPPHTLRIRTRVPWPQCPWPRCGGPGGRGAGPAAPAAAPASACGAPPTPGALHNHHAHETRWQCAGGGGVGVRGCLGEGGGHIRGFASPTGSHRAAPASAHATPRRTQGPHPQANARSAPQGRWRGGGAADGPSTLVPSTRAATANAPARSRPGRGSAPSSASASSSGTCTKRNHRAMDSRDSAALGMKVTRDHTCKGRGRGQRRSRLHIQPSRVQARKRRGSRVVVHGKRGRPGRGRRQGRGTPHMGRSSSPHQPREEQQGSRQERPVKRHGGTCTLRQAITRNTATQN
jgi:hypothetical protein